jgi:hypothetical protein
MIAPSVQRQHVTRRRYMMGTVYVLSGTMLQPTDTEAMRKLNRKSGFMPRVCVNEALPYI